MNWSRIFQLVILGLLLVGSVHAAQNDATGPMDGVSTVWPVDILGTTQIKGNGTAMLIESPARLGGTLLQAEVIVIDIAWQRGLEVRGTWPLIKQVAEQGQDTVTLRDVDVTFEAFEGDPLFLAFSPTGTMDLLATSPTGFNLMPIKEETLVAVGSDPNAIGAGAEPRLGFWHSIDSPMVQTQGEGAARATGSFTLFPHNVAIIAHATDTRWSGWTGYWERDRDRPVTEYEFRVTQIHVQNGTFTGASMDGLKSFHTSFTADTQGLVSAGSVSGHLARDDGVYRFDRDPLLLRGPGTLSIATDTAENRRPGDGAGIALRLEPSGSFAVSGASRVEATTDPSTAPSSGIWALGTIGAIALLLTTGMMVLGIVPAPTEATRRRQYDLWMQRGRAAAYGRHWGRAANCFKRAAHSRRKEPLAWFEWACAELEAGDPVAAEQIARCAMDVPGMDRLDLLELRAAAAWANKDPQAFEAHLTELAEGAPAMAHGLVIDLDVDLSRLDARLMELLTGRIGERDLDGYA